MNLDDLHSEPVGGGPGYVVVRISGHGRAEVAGRLAPPTLLVADGPRWRRLATVPGTEPIAVGPHGPSFAVDVEVPLHLLVDGGAWWLEPGVPLGGGEAVAGLAARVDALATELQALRARLGGGSGPAPPDPPSRFRATAAEPRPEPDVR